MASIKGKVAARSIFDSVSKKHRVDPYLVWAHATNYKYEKVEAVATIMVEIRYSQAMSDFSAWAAGSKWIRVTPAYGTLDEGKLKFCTCHLLWSFLGELLADTNIGDFWKYVERFELAASVAPQYPFVDAVQLQSALRLENFDPRKVELAADGLAVGQVVPLTRPQNFLGVVDISIPYANDEWREKLLALWDQHDTKSTVPSPDEFRYGREWNPVDGTLIHPDLRTVSDEDASYAAHEFPHNLNRRTHGAAVVSQLVFTTEDVNEIKFLAVQLPKETLAFTARSALSAYVLDAVAWMMTSARPRDFLTVNISLGTHAGPHDGSSMLERALDSLISSRRVKVADHLGVVLASGNSYEARAHAVVSCKREVPARLHWQIMPDDVTPSFVEIWFPKNTDASALNLRVELTSPTGSKSRFATIGTISEICAPEGYAAMVIFPVKPSGGDGLMVLVAVAPTSCGIAEAGRWTVEIAADGDVRDIHAYIERDSSMFDPSRPFGRQSYFDDALYEKAGRTPERMSDIGNKSVIKRGGTLNSLGTGRETLVIGSYFHTGKNTAGYHRPARYAAAGPTRDGRDAPDASSVGEDGYTLGGINVTGSLSGTMTRLAGTSVAAPEVAGLLATAMSQPTWNGTSKQWLKLYLQSLDPNKFPDAWLKKPDPQIGMGCVPRSGLTGNPHQ